MTRQKIFEIHQSDRKNRNDWLIGRLDGWMVDRIVGWMDEDADNNDDFYDYGYHQNEDNDQTNAKPKQQQPTTNNKKRKLSFYLKKEKNKFR